MKQETFSKKAYESLKKEIEVYVSDYEILEFDVRTPRIDGKGKELASMRAKAKVREYIPLKKGYFIVFYGYDVFGWHLIKIKPE